MTARKTAAKTAEPVDEIVAPPTRDDVLAETLRRMGATDSHADAGRIVNVPENRMRSFRQGIRNGGTFKSKGDPTDAAAYAHAYAEVAIVRRYVDAYVDGIVGTDAPTDAPAQ